MDELRRAQALAAATRALSRRDFTEQGLRERLRRAGVAPAEEEETLATLRRAGLVDDARFACGRAEALAERGRGDAAIRHDLEHQGVSADEIEAAIACLEPERERAARLVARRGGGAATARMLARRGFDEEVVEAVVAQDV